MVLNTLDFIKIKHNKWRRRNMATRSGIIGKIDEFNSDKENWENYSERLGLYFAANGITEADTKRAILLTVVGADTYKLFRNLVCPQKPSEKTYTELITCMNTHQQPIRNPIMERFKFNKRYRQPHESINDYMAKLRELAEYCNYGAVLNDMLRDRLVCGVGNQEIQEALLAKGETLTLDDAVKIANTKELSKKQSVNIQQTVTANLVDRDILKVAYTDKSKTKEECYRCGYTGHRPDGCGFKFKECYFCRNKGHSSRVCRKKAKFAISNTNSKTSFPDKSPAVKLINTNTPLVNKIRSDNVSDDEDADIYNVYMNTYDGIRKVQPILVDVVINNRKQSMELDTGAALSVMGIDRFNKLFEQHERPKIKKVKFKLRTYTGELITPVGVVDVQVKYESEIYNLPLILTPGACPPLFGRMWLKRIQINWKKVFDILQLNDEDKRHDRLQTVLDKYADVFHEDLGKFKNTIVTIPIKEDMRPEFCKARPVSYIIKQMIEDEL